MQGQTIKQDGDVYPVAMNGHNMAVGSSNGLFFTYILNQTTNTWIRSGKHFVRGELSCLSIRNDLMVATITDMENNPDECGIVYKLKSNNNNNNKSIGSITATNNNNNDVVWKEFARLTTKGDPLTTGDQRHTAGSIAADHKIFTARFDGAHHEGVGRVFVHDLSKYKE